MSSYKFFVTIVSTILISIIFLTACTSIITTSTPTPIPTDSAPQAAPDVVNADLPNFVIIMTDDQRYDTLEFMPLLETLLMDEGATFTRAYVTTPQCCPARTSFLLGEYTHNHEIYGNEPVQGGGFPKLRDMGHEARTIAYRLDEMGYRTMMAGKYQVLYPADTMTYVPVGWDEWIAWWRYREWDEYAPDYLQPGETNRDQTYYNYYINRNGSVSLAGETDEDYLTDFLTREAVSLLNTTPDNQPFLLFMSNFAPHPPEIPAPRHNSSYSNFILRDTPSRTPTYDQRLRYTDYLEMLLALDEQVEAIVDTLEAQNRLDNTYIIFVSDNGLMMTEHGLHREKRIYYEEAIRVPWIMRGPGIDGGQVIEEQILNIDLAPTIADIVGLDTNEYDGRSIMPLVGDTPVTWRNQFLIEQNIIPNGESWFGVRTEQYTYAEIYEPTDDPKIYLNAEPVRRVLFDNIADPYQVDNIIDNAPASLITALENQVADLLACRATTCREVENRTIDN